MWKNYERNMKCPLFIVSIYMGQQSWLCVNVFVSTGFLSVYEVCVLSRTAGHCVMAVQQSDGPETEAVFQYLHDDQL